jgi:hypothetical protein
MRIGVLSDTHIPFAAARLPDRVAEILSSMDAIIHAGDYQDAAVADELQSIAELYGVCGNMDSPDIKHRLPDKRIVQLAGFSIGIIHGWGSPSGLQERVIAAFAGNRLDAIIYGHSHRAFCGLIDGVLVFNPGSPTDTRFADVCTLGILTLDKTISGEIVCL